MSERVASDLLRMAERAFTQRDILMKALESLLVDPPATLDEPDTDCEVIVKMRAIARDALASVGEGKQP